MRRNQHNLPDDISYRDEDVLNELYHNRGLSLEEVAGEFDVDRRTITKWMDRHDIERRSAGRPKWHLLAGPAHFGTDGEGYEFAQTQHENELFHVYIHRLLAVAKCGFEEVVGKHVHHIKPIPWLNTPENITVKTPEDHIQAHSQKLEPSEYVEIREKYENTDMNTNDLADEYGLDSSTVTRTVNGEYNS